MSQAMDGLISQKKHMLPAHVLTGEAESDDLSGHDCRSAFIKDIDASGAYHIPSRSPAAMRDLLAQHLTRRDPQGLLRLCWDIRMNFSHDLSGKVAGGEDLNPAYDQRWLNLLQENPGIIGKAHRNALAPYLGENIAILEDPDLRCGLVHPKQDQGWLFLKHVDGQDISATCHARLRERIADCDTAMVSRIFAITRVLDEDTARPFRAYAVAWELNRLRAEREIEWHEIEPELNFST